MSQIPRFASADRGRNCAPAAMVLDFTVLVMTLWGLQRLGTPNSSLWKLLSRDSIVYCAGQCEVSPLKLDSGTELQSIPVSGVHGKRRRNSVHCDATQWYSGCCFPMIHHNSSHFSAVAVMEIIFTIPACVIRSVPRIITLDFSDAYHLLPPYPAPSSPVVPSIV